MTKLDQVYATTVTVTIVTPLEVMCIHNTSHPILTDFKDDICKIQQNFSLELLSW